MEFNQCDSCIHNEVCNRKSDIDNICKLIEIAFVDATLQNGLGNCSVEKIIERSQDIVRVKIECTAYKENKPNVMHIPAYGSMTTIPCTVPDTINPPYGKVWCGDASIKTQPDITDIQKAEC